MSIESLGQIKLGITTNANLKRAASQNPVTLATVKENSPLRHRSNFAPSNVISPVRQSQTRQNIEMSFNRTGLELLNKPEADLKNTLMEKMSELDELNR